MSIPSKIFWQKFQVSQVSRTQRTSSSEVPLPRLSSRGDDDDEDEVSESVDEGSDEEDDTQAEGEESSTADDAPNSSSVTRAKILQRTAKLGQAVLPPKRENKATPKAAQQPVCSLLRHFRCHLKKCQMEVFAKLIFTVFQSLTIFFQLVTLNLKPEFERLLLKNVGLPYCRREKSDYLMVQFLLSYIFTVFPIFYLNKTFHKSVITFSFS